MFKSSNAKIFKCSSVQMLKFSNVQIFKSSNIQTFKCSNVQMLQFSNGAGLLEEPGRQPSEPAARTAARRTPGELLTTKIIKFINEQCSLNR